MIHCIKIQKNSDCPKYASQNQRNTLFFPKRETFPVSPKWNIAENTHNQYANESLLRPGKISG